jgi:UPF0716 family protein affecting phage T7 exclusion
MKRVSLAIGVVALLEVLLLWRLEQRSSLLFVGAYLLLSAASGIAVIAHAARQTLGLNSPRAPRNPASPADRLWVLLAGVLLIVPGILSDLAALVLLAPPGRALVRRWVGPRLRLWASSGSNLSGTWARFGEMPSANADASLDENTIDVTSRPVASRQRVSSRKK